MDFLCREQESRDLAFHSIPWNWHLTLLTTPPTELVSRSTDSPVARTPQPYHYSTPCSEAHWTSRCVPQLHHTRLSEHLGPKETAGRGVITLAFPHSQCHLPCLPAPIPHLATLRSKLQSNLRSSAIKTDPLIGAEGGGAMGLQAFSG